MKKSIGSWKKHFIKNFIISGQKQVEMFADAIEASSGVKLDRFYRKATISFSKKFTRSCIYLGYSFHVFLQCR